MDVLLTPYNITLAFMVYILSVTTPLIFFIIKQYIKDQDPKKYKYIRSNKIRIKSVLRGVFNPLRPQQTLSTLCFWLGIASIICAATFMILFTNSPNTGENMYNQILSLFVGLWAPTLILISLATKK